MQIHQLKPKIGKKAKKRIARGGSHGKTSGRGEKGQKSRAGRRMRPELRDFIKKFPKKRGYRFKSVSENIFSLNVGDLSVFKNGDTINPSALLKAGMVRKIKGRVPEIKILGGGDVKNKIFVKNCFVSKQAREKILKAGGEIGLS